MAGAVAAGIRAGKAFIEMGLNDAALQTGLKAAQAKLNAFGGSLAKVGAGIGALGLSLTAPILAASEKFAEGGAILANASARTGMSVEALSQLSFAAKMTGTDLAGVEVGIRKMQKSMLAGSLENEMAAQTFANLGLSVEALTQLHPDQQFAIIAKSLARIQNPAIKAGAAMQIFGRSGSMLVPLIDNFQELTQEAREFGLVTSKESAQSALALQRSTNLLNAAIGKIVSTVGSAVAPSWTKWNNAMAMTLKSVKEFIAEHKSMIVTIYNVGFALTVVGGVLIGIAGAIKLVSFAISGLIGAIKLLVGAVNLLITAFTFLMSPLGVVVAALAGLTYWFLTSTEAGKKLFVFLSRDFGKAFEGISNAINAGEFMLAFKILGAFLTLEFTRITNIFKQLWVEASAYVQDVFARLYYSVLRTFVDLTAKLKTILAGVLGGDLGKIEVERVAEIRALNKEQAADAIKRANAKKGDTAVNDAEIAIAEAELNKLVNEANRLAARKKKGFPEGDAGLELPQFQGAQQGAKSEVQGTFGKLAGLGIGSSDDSPAGQHKTAKEQLAQQKKAVKHLEDINKKTELAKKLMFG